MIFNSLQLSRAFRNALLFLLLGAVGKINAMEHDNTVNYDFSAVCSTGQTLYYQITDGVNVAICCPNGHYNNWNGYAKPIGEITLPASVEYNGINYSITSIGSYAFWDCNGLTGSISIPNFVTSIGTGAFLGCSGLTSISIPNSVTEIGQSAFVGTGWYNQSSGILYLDGCCLGYNGTKPTGVLQIEAGTRLIASHAFDACNGLYGTLSIPNSVISIGDYAFYNCSGLTGLSIPNTVTTIGNYTFNKCSGITSISIPNTIINIGLFAFKETGWYNNQTDGVLYLDGCCLGYKGAKPTGELQIEENTRIIASGAFWECSELTGSLIIPNTVITIGEYAFSDCSGLTGNLVIPNSVTRIGKAAFKNCTGFTGSLTLGNSITVIEGGFGSLADSGIYGAFSGCSGFTGNLTIPNSITSIGDFAFYNCSGFSGDLLLPSSVTRIGKAAFRNCSGFTGDLTIPFSLICIEGGYFDNGYSYGSLGTFDGCCGFTGSLIIPNTVIQIGERAFSGCSGFTGNLVIPDSVIIVGTFAFSSCAGLTGDLIVPNSVTVIGYGAFLGCSGFSGDLIIGNSVTTIESFAFSACTHLSSIVSYAETPPSLGDTPFYSWNFTKPVYVPCGCWESYASLLWGGFNNFYGMCNYSTIAVANPTGGGIVAGDGTYYEGTTVILVATAKSGYTFIDWTEGGNQVSTDPTYIFTARCNRNLVANFDNNGSGSGDDIPIGAISGQFTVDADGKQVYFSRGNLQYYASTKLWRFAENQWDYIGADNDNAASAYNSWIDNFAWGTSGFNHGAISYQPWSASTNDEDYYAYGLWNAHLYSQTGQADWGYNKIANGGNQINQWHTLKSNEWDYLFNYRQVDYRFSKAKVNNISGYILLPDNWETSIYSLNNINESGAPYNTNIISAANWATLESSGAVFLPVDGNNLYWSSEMSSSDYAKYLDLGQQCTVSSSSRSGKKNVRLVCLVPTLYSIEVTPSPTEGGVITGAGSYLEGETCTLTATPNLGYHFVNWTKDNVEVSTEATYSFEVHEDGTYVANFAANVYFISVGANPTNGGTVTGGNSGGYGSLVTLIATPNEGYCFVNWTRNGEIVSTEPTYSFIVTESAAYQANFAQQSFHFITAGNWSVASNWLENELPGSTDQVFINANCTLDTNAEAVALTVDSDIVLTIQEASILSISGTITTPSTTSLIIADGGQLVTDNAVNGTIQKSIAGYGESEDGYYFIASPVDDFDPNDGGLLTSNYDLYYFDQTQEGEEWRNYEAAVFNLNTGKGYLYASQTDVTLNISGELTAAKDPVELVNQTGVAFEGWNLIGNPYPCNVTINVPFYRMYSDGSGLATQTTNLETTAIKPMEGVFVQYTTEAPSVTFTKAPNVSAEGSRGALNLSLGQGRGVKDNAIIRFDGGKTLEKFNLRKGSSIFITEGNKDYAVVNAEKQGEIPVSFKTEKNGSYTLSFSNEDVEFSYLHLIDNMTGNDVDLLHTPSYSFEAKTTDYASRFRLVFSTGSNANDESFGFVNTMGNFCIYGIEGDATVQVIDAMGRILSSETFSGSCEKQLGGSAGVYVVRLINGDSVRTQKIVVR